MKMKLLVSVIAMGIASSSIAFDGGYGGIGIGYDRINTNLKGFSDDDLNLDGAGLDLLAGYGVVTDNIYFGGELILGGSTAEVKSKITSQGLEAEVEMKSKIHYGAVARVGYVINDTALLFVKGGIDFRQFEGKTKNNFGLPNAKVDETVTGLVGGAGAEFKFNNNLSFRADYTYANYEKGKKFDVRTSAHRILAGLSFYF